MVVIGRLQLSQKAACDHSAHLQNNQTFPSEKSIENSKTGTFGLFTKISHWISLTGLQSVWQDCPN
jgi:hypothetical protein